MTDWQTFREPLPATLARTFGIAIVAGAIAAALSGRFRYWPIFSLVMLWPSFGGHWLEVFFLNGIRPRLSAVPAVQRGARLLAWFIGGIVLVFGARLTATLLLARPSIEWLTWATAGAAFVAVELIAHAALQLRGRSSFYNGRG